MLTIKRTAHVSQPYEFTFTAADLVEAFTDQQLREVGLFRDLRDADIERGKKLLEAERAEAAQSRHACDTDDCDCACHDIRPLPGRKAPQGFSEPLSEATFWPLIRALMLRRDFANLQRELEQRAWENGNTTIDFARAFGVRS